MSVVIASLLVIGFLALLVWVHRWGQTNVPNLRSYTPTCPNCDREIRATNDNAPNQKDRLRDHLKECEQW